MPRPRRGAPYFALWHTSGFRSAGVPPALLIFLRYNGA